MIPADAGKNSGPFLGVGWKGGLGVNDVLWARLQRAERWLIGRMDADIEAHGKQAHPDKGAPLTKSNASDLRYWLGVRETHYGQRKGDGQAFHRTGSALDVNYATNPWLATRTGKTLGGEAATDVAMAQKSGAMTARVEGLRGLPAEAVDVFDRATAWVFGRRANLHAQSASTKDLSPGEREQRAVAQWTRFQEVSDAVASYFALAYTFDRQAALAPVMQAPAQDEPAEGDVRVVPFATLKSLPRRPDALDRITTGLPSAKQPWSKAPQQVYRRMPADLHTVAKVLVRGTASNSPGNVRNPLLGVMDFKKELVQALVGVAGLHWGATEFGAQASGDMMHFDLGFAPKNNQEPDEEFKP